MEKDERRIREKRRMLIRVLIVCGVVVLFSLGLFIHSRKNGVVNASDTDMAKTQKDKPKKEVPNMDNRESKLALNKNSTESAGEYKPWELNKNDGKKVAYLTFDDGPSTNNTPKILDMLKKNNINATFFLIGKNAEANKDLVKREVAEGNVVGNHTYSHQLNYREGAEKFVEDLDKCDKVIKSIIGDSYNLKLARFPGGSFGPKLEPFRQAAAKAGYHYVDWNDLTGDAEHNNVSVDNLLKELQKYTTQNHVVILMHDAAAKTTTAEALPEVIAYLKSKGYTFDTLK